MEHYLHKLKQSIRPGGGGANAVKKLFVAAIVLVVLGIIIVVVLAVLIFNWLADRGSQVRDMGQNFTQQAQSYVEPLSLQSYVRQGGQVDTARLQETFNNVPGQLQGMWLDQLKKQIDDMHTQAGVSDQTVQTLTTLYDDLKQAQGQ